MKKKTAEKFTVKKLVYQRISLVKKTCWKSTPKICYMVCNTWQCLCKCVVYHLFRGLLYCGIFHCRFLQRHSSARGFFSLLDYQYDIISVWIRLAVCPSSPTEWPVFVLLCNCDWCFVRFCLSCPPAFVRWCFFHAPHDLSGYEMFKYEISITAKTHDPPPPPPFRKILYLPDIFGT